MSALGPAPQAAVHPPHPQPSLTTGSRPCLAEVHPGAGVQGSLAVRACVRSLGSQPGEKMEAVGRWAGKPGRDTRPPPKGRCLGPAPAPKHYRPPSPSGSPAEEVPSSLRTASHRACSSGLGLVQKERTITKSLPRNTKS